MAQTVTQRKLEWKVGAGAYAKLLNVMSYPSIGFEMVKVDSTECDSANTTSEPGIPSIPDLTFKIKFGALVTDSFVIMAGYMASGTEIDWKYTTANGVYTFKGYVGVKESSIVIDGLMTADLKILVSSDLTVA